MDRCLLACGCTQDGYRALPGQLQARNALTELAYTWKVLCQCGSCCTLGARAWQSRDVPWLLASASSP